MRVAEQPQNTEITSSVTDLDIFRLVALFFYQILRYVHLDDCARASKKPLLNERSVIDALLELYKVNIKAFSGDGDEPKKLGANILRICLSKARKMYYEPLGKRGMRKMVWGSIEEAFGTIVGRNVFDKSSLEACLFKANSHPQAMLFAHAISYMVIAIEADK